MKSCIDKLLPGDVIKYARASLRRREAKVLSIRNNVLRLKDIEYPHREWAVFLDDFIDDFKIGFVQNLSIEKVR